MASALRTKTAVLLAAAVASTLLLTACQGSDSDSDNGAQDTSSGSPLATQPDAGAASVSATPTANTSDGDATSGGGSASDSGSGSGSDATSGGSETVIEGIDQGKGVNGTWNGKVRFLAPGKYTVTGSDGTDQQFLVSEDTDIEGTGDICGTSEGQAAMPCSEEMLEAATKGDGVDAEVVVANGIAKSIVDNH
ncbi:hypothetical protein [Streptomyces sp. NBC_00102]|uniref:hypothetical protein n=1 Tax=Streptomyces sp. NBC_00102 TaxID=2975652 RepID=UPI00224F8D90|nr:hypothetical protein [Streptomyces sp. NBC_00102]MCX5398416.1 hypothetical protein [Streptomyces sp. NBC_00102]